MKNKKVKHENSRLLVAMKNVKTKTMKRENINRENENSNRET
mgnify:CR=1 FL=1